MERAGFQLSSRFDAAAVRGEQAGRLRAVGEHTAVIEASGIQYAHQTSAGSARVESERARWKIEWTAPTCESGPVVFHVAGNAANGDASALGDRVYAIEVLLDRPRTVQPRSTGVPAATP